MSKNIIIINNLFKLIDDNIYKEDINLCKQIIIKKNELLSEKELDNINNKTIYNGSKWQSIVWANSLNLYVAVSISGDGNRVMYSSDTINWTYSNREFSLRVVIHLFILINFFTISLVQIVAPFSL